MSETRVNAGKSDVMVVMSEEKYYPYKIEEDYSPRRRL